MTHASGWTLAVHGGSGHITPETVSAAAADAARAGLTAALDAGSAVLAAGGTALDAVEAAVRVLEDDPAFNAGRGAALTADGTAELDAAIMEGTGRRAGAVAGVTTARNPVSLARAVMEDTPHALVIAGGADALARAAGVALADGDWFVTDARRAQLAELLARGGDAFDVDMKYGTVGAVARDAAGRLAAATSTGGVTGKRPGRVGDSPIVGAGTLADDRAGAVSATGTGEVFLRLSAAHEILARMRLGGEGADAAVRAVLDEVRAHGGTGGVILAPANGDPVWHFTTPGMNRGLATAAGVRIVALFGDDRA